MINLKTGKHFNGSDNGSFNGSRMTRGGFLKGILASGIAPSITLATIANAGSANASVGRGMMRGVGGRMATMSGGGGLSAKSYVQDGLVAMWDGIENVGWGAHDSNSTTWVDLIRNTASSKISFTPDDKIFWLNNCLYSTGDKTIRVLTPSPTFLISDDFTFDVAFSSECELPSASNMAIVSFSQRFIRIFSSSKGNSSHNIYFGGINSWPVSYERADSITQMSLTKSYNSDTTKSVYGVYHNGLLKRSTQNASSALTSSDMYIFGYEMQSFVTAPSRIFSIRIYNRTLSADEISANYEIDKERFNIP